MKCSLSILAVSSVLAFAGVAAADGVAPFKTTVGEFFENPIGRDLSGLSFSWQIPNTGAGAAQSAYEIDVRKDGKSVWRTGKVESDASVKVPYGGAALKSGEKFTWRVRYWDEKGAVSDWSKESTFETGLLELSDWKGEWISSPAQCRPLYSLKAWRKGAMRNFEKIGVPPAYFRKSFAAKKAVKSARLYAASRGIFEFSINGKPVSDTKWGTGWTSYSKRITSDTFDVSALLQNGENTIGAILADGWYAGRIENRWLERKVKPELLAQLEIEYADGSREIVATDSSWKSSSGAYYYSDIYDGEYCDANLEPENWDANGFDDSAWQNAATSAINPKIAITPRRNQPIRVCERLAPISVKRMSAGTYIFDLGQNMVGVPRISVKGVKGRPIKIRYAEMLNKDGTMYTVNYRSAVSTDHYVPASNEVETYTPKFTFHGFRYVEISGLDAAWKPDASAVEGLVMHNDMPQTGTFVCSNPKINKLQQNIVWGQRGNYFSVPTDCPQRDERMGWTGDAQVFIPTAAFNMNVDGFFSKWNQDMRDCQEPSGAMAHVVPCGWGSGSAAWGDAAVICPWEIYLAYGDKKSLAENFDMMKKWVDFQKNTSKDLIRPDSGFGDWLQPSSTFGNDSKNWRGATPRPLIGTAYFARTADIVSKAAKILGKRDEAKKYADLARDVRAAFVRNFVSPDGSVKGDAQTAYLLPLAFDILPENMRAKVFGKFLKALKRDNLYLDTGFVGTPLLAGVLSKFGRSDLAYKIVQNEGYPSWIYSINQGATTMWERWNSFSHERGFGEASMNSFNHYAYGSIGKWLYANAAGINYDENAVGYKNIIFAPEIGGVGFDYAAATFQSPYGKVVSSWSVKGGKCVWNVSVPPNSTGTLVIPAKNVNGVMLNGKPVDSLTQNVASGDYKVEFSL